MLHPSTKKLIDRLIDMTAAGKIEWTEGEGETVVYTTEGYSVGLEADPNEMVITATDGRELERATVAELAEATDADGASYTERVAEMTREAMRKAKGIDKAITTLLAGIDLDGDGVPDIPAESLEADIAEANAVIEDTGDDSAAVSAEEVESLESESEAEAEVIENLAAADVETAGFETEAVEATETVETEATASVDEDMTEAVARLADEVNEREAEAASHTVETEEAEA
ncbi:MAG: hypothetical protein AAFR74_09010, partial [Pseudomonadota bacterium]